MRSARGRESERHVAGAGGRGQTRDHAPARRDGGSFLIILIFVIVVISLLALSRLTSHARGGACLDDAARAAGRRRGQHFRTAAVPATPVSHPSLTLSRDLSPDPCRARACGTRARARARPVLWAHRGSHTVCQRVSRACLGVCAARASAGLGEASGVIGAVLSSEW